MGKKILLDPGHGGSYSGTIANGIVEKELNLSLALRLERKFREYDCEILLSRTDDSRVTLAERVSLANEENVDFFLSLHSNGFSNTSANGYEDYIYPSTAQTTINYQNIFHKHVSAVWTRAGRANRGKKEADFYVLRETKMPALLVENGFITNSTDANLLKTEAFTEELLEAMLAGIVEALDIPKIKIPPEKLYRVQAGAFSTRERAEEHVRRLKAAGFDAFIINPIQ